LAKTSKGQADAFRPRREVLDLLPEERGNDINGLGETAPRRPRPIMWHDASILAHGRVQQWFYTQGSAPGAKEHKQKNMEYAARSLPDVAKRWAELSAEAWTARVKQAALGREADLVGIARLDPQWVFEGYEAPWTWMIMLGVAMDPEAIATAPSARSQTEVHKQYGRATRAAHKLASWIREEGWDAEPHGGPKAGPVLMIPAAIAAGFGELGKHGSLINRQFGSSLRLSCVLTNMPLIADRPDEFGADDFCARCQVCARACPVDAIGPVKQLVRGAEKWYVDFDKCILYFVENNGCGACIGQCPWSREGVAPRLAEKMARRRVEATA
jgi:ferredoxin